MRGKPPAELIKRRKGKTKRSKARSTSGALLTVAGLLIGILGLLAAGISLRARPTLALEPPTDPDDVLSTRVVISNAGLLSLNNVVAHFWVRNVKYAGNTSETDTLHSSDEPMTLLPDEPKTVGVGEFVKFSNPILSADVVVAIYYDSPVLIFWRRHRLFRLVSVPTKDGKVRLEKQTVPEEMERAFDEKVAGVKL